MGTEDQRQIENAHSAGEEHRRGDCGIQPRRLGTKEAEMKIVGCDLHAKQQTIAMVDTDTGEFIEKTIPHEGSAVREFYESLPGPVVVGIEATGSMQWFLELLEELGIESRVGHPAKIRAG
jgi:hypothetical protein